MRFVSPRLDWEVTHLALSCRRGENGLKLVACANESQVRMWAGGDASRPHLVEISRQQQADLSRLSLNTNSPAPGGTPVHTHTMPHHGPSSGAHAKGASSAHNSHGPAGVARALAADAPAHGPPRLWRGD